MKEHKQKFESLEKLELNEIKDDSSSNLFKKVHCPSCNNEVAADNLNLQNKIAKCSGCNVLFSIDKEVESIRVNKEAKQEFLRPEGIELFYFDEDLDITVDQHIQGIDAFAIVMIPLVTIASILVYFFPGKFDLSPFIPIVLTLASLYFIYRGFNYSKNKTYIDINDKFLELRSDTNNLNKDKKYRSSEIDQLYIKKSPDGSGYFAIHLIVNSPAGQAHHKLLTVNTLTKAKFLEQEIESYLKIENRKTPEQDV